MPRREARSTAKDSELIYGVNPVVELLRASSQRVQELCVSVDARSANQISEEAALARVSVRRVPREQLDRMTGGLHQGVVAVVKPFAYANLSELLDAAAEACEPPLLVVLDGIVDPQNLGAIIRSAHALGAHGVVIPADRSATVNGTVAKASAGAVEHCPIARVVNLSRAIEWLKDQGLWVAAADPRGELSLPDVRLDGPMALVVGAEGPGIRKGVLEHCDFRVHIPMAGRVASLNASVCAALMLYEVRRQRLRPAAL